MIRPSNMTPDKPPGPSREEERAAIKLATAKFEAENGAVLTTGIRFRTTDENIELHGGAQAKRHKRIRDNNAKG